MAMNMRVLIVFSCISLVVLQIQKPEVDRTGFGPKTVYEWVPGLNLTVSENMDMVVDFKNRVCTAVHTSMVFRHGNRWPSLDDAEDMRRFAERLIDADLPPTASVKFITDRYDELFYPEELGNLDFTGEIEMDKLGARVRQRFHKLFMNKNAIIETVSSDMNRTKDSADYFSNAFIRDHMVNLSIDDELVRFYSNCSTYETTMEQNKNVIDEVNEYTSSFEVQRVLRKIEDRLGIKDLVNLTYNDAKLILEWCAMYSVNEGAENPWCKSMTSFERTVLEYAADLDYYLRYSYGNDLMKNISCVILQKWLTTMDDVIDNRITMSKRSLLGSFMFGHTGTLLGTLTALGLFKDAPPLSATNVKSKRQFKNSKIAPMSGNVGIVLYSCADYSAKEKDPKYAVQVFVNEQLAQLPQFSNYIVWYDDFKRVFSTAECNISKICEPETELGRDLESEFEREDQDQGPNDNIQDIEHNEQNQNEALSGARDPSLHLLSKLVLILGTLVLKHFDVFQC